MQNQRKAYIYALLAIGFWSTMGSAFKLSLGYLSYTSLLFFTSFISLVTLACITILTGKWPFILHAGKKDWMMSALMGLLNPFGYYIILFKAYSLISAQEAVALNYTWPLVLVLLSIPVLKQKIGIKTVLSIMLSFLGALLVVTKGDFSFFSVQNPLGSILALSSSVIWAAFWLLNVKDQRKEEIKLFMNFIFGFLYSLLYVALFSEWQLPSGSAMYGIVYIGVFEMGITFFFWLKALQYSVTTAKVTKLVYLSPFISLILIHFLVGESIHVFTWIGLLLIIAGIMWEGVKKARGR